MKRTFISLLILMSFATLAVASTVVDAKYKEIGAATLGKPAGAEKSAAGGGRVRLYANGGIWSSLATGAHAVYGPAFEKYKSLKAEKGELGYPVSDTLRLADGSEQTLFRHGYILVDKNGAASAQVMPKATFTADSVTTKGMKPAMQKDSFFLPQEPAGGTTFSCNCINKKGEPGTGNCAVRADTNTGVVRCAQVNCGNSCRLILQGNAQ